MSFASRVICFKNLLLSNEKQKFIGKKIRITLYGHTTKKNRENASTTDLEFNQNKIKQLSQKFDVEMFHTHLRGGKAFATEQKIREFKKVLLGSKRFEKMKKYRIRPNQLLKECGRKHE